MLALFMALAATQPAQTDILGQFKAGKSLCVNPDARTKTCSTIDRLTVRANGVMVDTGETLIAPDKPLTLEVASPAHIEAGALCAVMSMAHFQKAIVRADGKPLPPDRNAMVLEKLSKVFEPLAGRKVCEGLRVDNGKLMKFGQVERIDLPLPGKSVRWVAPNERYRVAPRLP